MSRKIKIHLSENPFNSSVIVDGHDLSSMVTGLRITFDAGSAQPASVKIELIGDIEIAGEVDIERNSANDLAWGAGRLLRSLSE